MFDSGTRNVALLVDEDELARLGRLRAVLDELAPGEFGPAAAAAAMLSERVGSSATNRDFLNEIA